MIGLIALALAAVTTTAGGPTERCDLPPGWSEVAGRGARYIVFGEVHGTREAPAFVGDVACGLAFDGERLLVAIEQDSSRNAALQIAWQQPDERFAAALRRTGWVERNDGVGSEAMFAMLLRLHRLWAGGRQIDIVGSTVRAMPIRPGGSLRCRGKVLTKRRKRRIYAWPMAAGTIMFSC